MLDTPVQIEAAAAAYKAGKELAIACTKKGAQFLGTFNVADACGYERKSDEWFFAKSGAAHIYADIEICTTRDGTVV